MRKEWGLIGISFKSVGGQGWITLSRIVIWLGQCLIRWVNCVTMCVCVGEMCGIYCGIEID